MNILELSKEAGFTMGHGLLTFQPQLARFAELVAAHEREACAKVCEEYDMDHVVGQQLADTIRARGLTKSNTGE